MRYALIGFTLIVAGIALLMLVPVIATFARAPWSSVDVSGLTCILIFFIPICLSVGMQPALTAILALVMAAVLALLAYIAFRIFKSITSHYEAY